jgi:mercuric ion transport protein
MRAEWRAADVKESMKLALPGVGGVYAAAGSALCCGGPVVAVSLGVSGSGLSAYEPYRPYFLGATALFLVAGFWMLDREERAACLPGKPCADPAVRRRMRVVLWIATGLAVVFATFPSWQTLIFSPGDNRDGLVRSTSPA